MSAHRVLITGASGLLGRAVLKEFAKHNDWEVMGLAFSRVKDGLRKVDLTQQTEVERVIQEFKPNVVVHAAAEKRPQVVEDQEEVARAINVTATTTICREAAKVGAWVIFISTDYVFDGDSPPYTVDAETNPLNKYGKSKVEGERATLNCSEANCVIRIPILYGEVEKLDESAVTCLFGPVKDTSKPCKMNDREKRYPTYSGDLAVTIRQLAEHKLKNPSIKGIFHFSNTEQMTKYDMAVRIAEAFSIPTDHIIADKENSPGARRPYDSQLDNSLLINLGIGQRTPFKQIIRKCLEPFADN